MCDLREICARGEAESIGKPKIKEAQATGRKYHRSIDHTKMQPRGKFGRDQCSDEGALLTHKISRLSSIYNIILRCYIELVFTVCESYVIIKVDLQQ